MANYTQIRVGTTPPSIGHLQAFQLGFCSGEGILYIGVPNEEDEIVPMVPGVFLEGLITTPATWDNKKITLNIIDIQSNSVVHIGLAQNATDAQAKAWSKASVICESQTTGSITLRAVGPAPTIAIPLSYAVGGGV